MRRGWGTAWPRFCRFRSADKQKCLELDDPIQRLDVLSPLVKDA